MYHKETLEEFILRGGEIQYIDEYRGYSPRKIIKAKRKRSSKGKRK